MKRIKYWLFLIVVSVCNQISAQEVFGTGAIIDDEAFNKTAMQFPLLTRSYENLPQSVSLKKYCPVPGNQGRYGTCVAWSSAYAGRTITEAIQTKRTTPDQNKLEAFSPGFLYYYIKADWDADCSNGAFISSAMEVLTNRGVPKKKDFNTDCVGSISSETNKTAGQFKIKGGSSLFRTWDNATFKVQSVKKALSQDKPVVFAMNCPPSFSKAGIRWRPAASENPLLKYGGHAMCIIGYDDTKYGGAFEIINSWGTNWANEGFVWISYDDFAEWSKQAFIIHGFDNPVNKQQLIGKFEINLVMGTDFRVSKNSNPGLAVYETASTMVTGINYRLFLENEQPCYVYVLGGDDSGEIDVLFPNAADISPYMAYNGSRIAIPGEQFNFQSTPPKGNDYLIVLYSKKSIESSTIIAEFKRQSGDFIKRSSAVLSKYISDQQITFSTNEIKFTAPESTSVVPFLIKIKRK